MFGFLLFCVIHLGGVSGESLRARAFFDANNVHVGDPLVLTVDFMGEATFTDLHPPALARTVSSRDWKVDDLSAKTDTFADGRRLVYRVRPMREGVLVFPTLAFSYAAPNGETNIVRANAIPVHARAGRQVVVAEMGEDETTLPPPPALVEDATFCAEGLVLSDDEAFKWRKACASPTADAFAAFAFPAARLNEATCAIREGNWARALSIYRRLEWRMGQTREIETGIVAALALKAGSPAVELPVVRQVLRPILRFAWAGRVALAVGALLFVVALFYALSRLVRTLAAFALLVAFVPLAQAETVETVTTNADGTIVHRKVVTGGSGNFSFSFSSSSSSSSSGGASSKAFKNFFDDEDAFFGRRRRKARAPVEIAVRMEADKESVVVGETFNLVLSIDQPRDVSFDQGVNLTVAENGRVAPIGRAVPLAAIKSENPTNVISRLSFPMRAYASMTNLHFTVTGDYAFADDPSFFFRTTTPYSSGEKVCSLVVVPPPEEDRPADFGGLVAESASLFELCDILAPETNDVITITYRLKTETGFAPAAFLPKDAAYEWTRQSDGAGSLSEIVYRRYFVADGAETTPPFSITYYDLRRRAYRTLTVGGKKLKYQLEGESIR